MNEEERKIHARVTEKTVVKADREFNIIALQDGAVGTPVEDYVNELILHYQREIWLYTFFGLPNFAEAVMNETEEPYLTYLDITVDQQGNKVRDLILARIT